MNTKEALDSYITGDAMNYTIHPQVSDYIQARKPLATNWEAFLNGRNWN
jgi:hypothetical protein